MQGWDPVKPGSETEAVALAAVATVVSIFVIV